MKRYTRNLLVGLCLVGLSACSDDSKSTADAGDGGADGDMSGDMAPDDDTGGAVTHDFFIYLPDDDGGRGEPAEGVNVAVDRDEDRIEFTTGADGSWQLELLPDEEVDITYALEGYIVLSFLGLTQEGVESVVAANPEDWNRVTMAELFDFEAWEANEVTLSYTATGVPEDGFFCTSSEEYNWGCSVEGGTATENVQGSDEEVVITAFSYDADWKIVDYDRMTRPSVNDDSEFEFEFDGEMDPAPTEITLQVRTPDDEDSPYRNETLETRGPWPFIVFEAGSHRVVGGAHDEIIPMDQDFVQLTLQVIPDAVEDAIYMINLSVEDSFRQRSNAFLAEAPEDDGVYLTMDVARISSPQGDNAALDSIFDWQEIADSQSYQLHIFGGGRILWVASTGDQTRAELPDLPTNYNPRVDWPFEGTEGSFSVWAFRDPDGLGAGDLDEPLRRELWRSVNQGTPIVLLGP